MGSVLTIHVGPFATGTAILAPRMISDRKAALVVGFNSMNVSCSPPQLCQTAETQFVSNLALDAEKIAQTIYKTLEEHSPTQSSWEQPWAIA